MAPSTTTENFLASLAIIYTVPWLVWRLCHMDSYAPLAIVQIVGGIVLGPGILGHFAPALHAEIFSSPVIQLLNGIAIWGVMIFVFLAGLELDLQEAWSAKRETAITASLALSTPLVFGAMASVLLLQQPGWIGERASTLQFIAGIGMACAVTALPILVLLLEKLALLRTPFGQRILRYASLDDLAIWAVLAFILLDWQRLGRQSGFILALIPACIIARKIIYQLAEQDRWMAALIWLIATSFAADWAGLHYMVGAFLAGAALDANWFNQIKRDHVRNAILLAMMPVFFLSTGLRTAWDVGGTAVFYAVAVLLVASIAGKLAGVHMAARILHWPRSEASIIGWLLQTKALIMIIFVNILLDRQIITNAMFTALLLMAVASTLLTIPMVKKYRLTPSAKAP
jgi:Kef-type K+ transport system membrane component KefB